MMPYVSDAVGLNRRAPGLAPLAERPSSRTRLRLDMVSDAPSGPSEVANPGCVVWLAVNAPT